MRTTTEHIIHQFSIDHTSICVIGLGYVGLPLARLFSTRFDTVGFDINIERVNALNAGHDASLEVSDSLLKEALYKYGLKCTADIEEIRNCNFYIVAVPTPIDDNRLPDLTPLINASKTVGSVLSKGDIVVYESTVYPGVTEEVCVPILEATSGLKFNEDFFCGYSPERINPGDKEHTVENIKKITSGSTHEVARYIDNVYNSVLINGTYLAPSIKVAEAAKVIENAQRDINIAFFNELSRIFNAMGINTNEVIDAAGSKWNFIRLMPGLVGGHCISVDPYYLIQKSREYGVQPDLMIAARSINEGMGQYVVERTIDIMHRKGIRENDAKILVLGITFKENCPDVRNTKVVNIINALKEHTGHITVADPWADASIVESVYGTKLTSEPLENLKGNFDAVILAVAHDEFRSYDIRDFLKDRDKGVVFDVKSLMPSDMADGQL
ncbi:MAG: nucleotide sugar dehydrogenase [Muribaculaceae bacterium]|nr:nucleotide sugar dehydrogenase [Muribaculaceae bacterium]